MPNRKQFVLAGLMTLGLLGCGKFEAAEDLPERLKIQSIDPAPVGVDLQLTALETLVHDDTVNSATIEGTRPGAVHRIHYRFNSGAADSFEIMELTRRGGGSGCQQLSKEKYFLKSNDSAQEIGLSRTRLTPNTDYVFEIVLNQEGCASVKLTYSVVAWAGAGKDVDPSVAVRCSSAKLGKVAFFQKNGESYVESSEPNQRPKVFLSGDAYCGENLKGVRSSCGRTDWANEVDGPKLTCSTVQDAKDKDKASDKSWSLNFHRPSATSAVSCKHGEQETFAETLTDCKALLLDFAKYN